MKNCRFVRFFKHLTHHNTHIPQYKNFKHPQTQGYFSLTLSGLDPKLFEHRENPFLDLYCSSSIPLKAALDYLEIELSFYTHLTPKLWDSLSLGITTPILSIEVIPCSQKILAIPDTFSYSKERLFGTVLMYSAASILY